MKKYLTICLFLIGFASITKVQAQDKCQATASVNLTVVQSNNISITNDTEIKSATRIKVSGNNGVLIQTVNQKNVAEVNSDNKTKEYLLTSLKEKDVVQIIYLNN